MAYTSLNRLDCFWSVHYSISSEASELLRPPPSFCRRRQPFEFMAWPEEDKAGSARSALVVVVTARRKVSSSPLKPFGGFFGHVHHQSPNRLQALENKDKIHFKIQQFETILLVKKSLFLNILYRTFALQFDLWQLRVARSFASCIDGGRRGGPVDFLLASAFSAPHHKGTMLNTIGCCCRRLSSSKGTI